MNISDPLSEQNGIALAELIEESEAEDDQKGSEMVVYKHKVKVVKQEREVKVPFAQKSKEQIEELSPREQFEYKIALSKHRTEKLKNEYQIYKQQESKANRSRENKRLIIMGRFLETFLYKRPEHETEYMVVEKHLDQYLTKDSDRELLGFPPLGTSNRDNSDNN